MKKIFVVALTMFSSITFASGYLVKLGEGVEISKVHAHSAGGLTLWVDASKLMNPDSCSYLNKVNIQSSQAGYDAMVTVIMTAYTTKKKIGFWSSGCQVLPFWGGTQTFPVVTNIWITD